VLKVAVTARAALMVTVQAPVPLHAPLQPPKVDPEAAEAVSATCVPWATFSVQSAPQEMPAGALDTVPVPVPFLVTDSTLVDVVGAEVVVEPLTGRDRVSPPPLKFTLPAKVPVVVGRNLTVTVRLAPAASEPEPPDTMLNGAPTVAVTERLALLVFSTVNVRSTEVLTVTLPKLVVAEGDTVRSGRAAPLAAAEQALSLPDLSTAVIRTKYVVPPLRPAMRVLTV
jgi:hypothetical protein